MGAGIITSQGLPHPVQAKVQVQRGEITDRIKVDTNAYAVMLGGPDRRHLFICVSDSHDPAEIQRNPSASFKVVEVDVPGAGIP